MASPSSPRSGADRCPGLLAPFVSADGAMVRLRVPGGRLNASTLTEISSLAVDFGNPEVTLTSRGSLQLRGLPDPLPRELITAIGDLGLIPSGAHDKARNIVADPEGGLDDLVSALDEGLLADRDLAGLPGRFLLAVAGPGGPVLGEPWDVAIVDDSSPDVRRRSEGGVARVLVDGRSVTVPREQAPDVALEVARRFLAARPDERTWNVRDLPAAARAALLPGGAPVVVEPAEPPRPGPLGEDLVVLVPLGLLTPAMAAALDVASRLVRRTSADVPVESRQRDDLRLTPWRSILVPGDAAHAQELAATGLAVSPDSPWTVLTACAGAPSCGRTDTPTRDLAREAAPFVDVDGPAVHVIGCDRACGHPARPHVTSLNPTSIADITAAQRSSPHEKA